MEENVISNSTAFLWMLLYLIDFGGIFVLIEHSALLGLPLIAGFSLTSVQADDLSDLNMSCMTHSLVLYANFSDGPIVSYSNESFLQGK